MSVELALVIDMCRALRFALVHAIDLGHASVVTATVVVDVDAIVVVVDCIDVDVDVDVGVLYVDVVVVVFDVVVD